MEQISNNDASDDDDDASDDDDEDPPASPIQSRSCGDVTSVAGVHVRR